jgi:hypothetical protein
VEEIRRNGGGKRERDSLRDSRCREGRSKVQAAKPVQWKEDGELGGDMASAQGIGRADTVNERPSFERNPMGDRQPGDMIGNPLTATAA